MRDARCSRVLIPKKEEEYLVTHIPDLTNIMEALRARASPDPTGTLIVTNPWQVLRDAGLDSERVGALAQGKHIQKCGAMAYAITSRVGETVPKPPTPPIPNVITPPPAPPIRRSWIVVMDANNIFRVHQDAGVPIRPDHLQRQLTSIGPIATTFAIGNYEAIPWEGRKAFAEAGFPIAFHCDALRHEKDMVDPHLMAYVFDFLAIVRRDVVAGVILVSDDAHFVPLARRILDQQWSCAAATFRPRAPLAELHGVTHIALALPTFRKEVRRWNPADVASDLESMADAEPREQREALLRIKLNAPLVEQVLRHFLLHLRRRHHGDPQYGFERLLQEIGDRIPEQELETISENECRAFLDLLIRIRILLPRTVPHPSGIGTYRGYRVDWTHPFCAEILNAPPHRRRHDSTGVDAFETTTLLATSHR
ncbi:NYN domain-containing protein [Candidatus Uhrbacteria bacterium]|nr:NYN domain-containing protein [Candidatus Uhrbacteria bacterium]